jgi:hypothetical protein
MKPVYVKKRNPRDRVTWMDRFLSLEPSGGVRSAVELARKRRA